MPPKSKLTAEETLLRIRECQRRWRESNREYLNAYHRIYRRERRELKAQAEDNATQRQAGSEAPGGRRERALLEMRQARDKNHSVRAAEQQAGTAEHST